MINHITCIDLFDHNVGMACAKVRFRCPCISLVLIYLIKKVGMVCAKVRVRCSCIILLLIYLIIIWVWHVPKLDSDDHAYYLYWFIWSKCALWHLPKLDSDDHAYYLYWFILIKMCVMACAKVRLRWSCILLVLIYLITMWVWHVPKFDLDAHAYHCY